MMVVMVVLVVVVLGLGFGCWLFHSGLLRLKGLPPGTMGWPFFGETSEFLRDGPSFMKNQRARYGSLFKTHILGCPTVVCMDSELNRLILMSEGKGLVPGYPQSMLNILGKSNIAAVHGSLHKTMRTVMLGLINPSEIRDKLLLKIDQSMRSLLTNWNDKVIDIQEKTKEMWLLSILNLIAASETGPVYGELKFEIYKLIQGTLSLPINFPGTNYSRGMQARKKIISILNKIINERRTSQRFRDDMLDSLLRNDDNTKGKLSDEQIIDLLITLIYSGFETVSATSMMAVKFLSDHPKVLEEIRNEHLEIRKRKLSEDAMDWNDYKSMKLTRAVIFETSRIANVVNGVLRKTTNDMELNGFTIPKGWKIYVYTRETNYDPFLYCEPLSFNPWRWLDGTFEFNQNFFGFGGGARLCPGKELGIATITAFLHYFVTRFRWEEVGRNEIMKFPRVEAPNGVHIKVWSY
ncbi:hypothetical protein J5N97_010205 [Dioscorea zingiberensis]|uniref:Cytochrome P450 85A1 n=1 Tax=Dioscorea zingiberensis TaxID=325984 RepID=A0A9D5CXZ5_9LILI|nr:hypothetical protein J5N97_010205 [Dioscorea zingiberensis]